MSNEKKELSVVQVYAVRAARDKVMRAQQELQSILQDVALELGIDTNRTTERWEVSADMKYFERMSLPEEEKK